MSTNCLIFAPFNLHRIAWHSLLTRQPGIVVAGAFADLGSLERGHSPEPATLLVDVPDLQVELVGRLRQVMPDSGILLLVSHFDLAEVVSYLRAGATGLISRDANEADLARAIIAASRGEVVLPSDLATRALVALARGEMVENAGTLLLTDREEEVLNLLSSGLTNKDIAQTLFLSVRTVEAHLHNVYGKLGVSSRTEAALWALNHGYGSLA